MRSILAAFLLASTTAGSIALAGGDAWDLPAGPTLQGNPHDPLWATLRATGRAPAEWATLLTSDADGDRMTDFLDLLAATAAATGASATRVELLVYADAPARAQLGTLHPGATDMSPVVPATFLTAPLGRLDAIRAIPGVGLVAFEPRAYTTSVSTNPAGGSPGSMPQNDLHQAPDAWSAGYTGTGVKVAIIDTGADAAHDALDGGKVTAFKDCVGSGTTSYDDEGHGTHVASIAAGDDGTDFSGVAPDADLVIVKVLDSGGSGTLAQFSCAVTWIKNSGSPRADVASMSAGLGVPPLAITTLNGGPTDLFGWDAVANQLPAADIPFTVAAGNWVGTVVDVIGASESTPVGVNGVNQVSSPGYAAGVITVGAIDERRTTATFTAIGPGRLTQVKPDVAAMGVLTWGALAGTGDDYETWSGTSMATPIAAGAIALMVDADATLPHTDYEAALRSAAGPACVAALGSACVGGVSHSPDPNFVVGWGVVKADDSIALL